MRELLFRGKDRTGILKHSWLYGSLDNCNEDFPTIMYKDRWGNTIYADIEIKTVGQFTGKTDKNGKKIFEGDILKIHYFKSYYIGKVVYNEKTCGFEFWYKSVVGAYGEKALHKMNFAQFTPFEVIGNIHDNPELLEAL